MGLSAEQRGSWEEAGFARVEGFADAETLSGMLDCVVELARQEAAGDDIRPAYVQREERIASPDKTPEDQLSKLFRVHREHEVFRRFATDPRLLALVADLLGPDLDCFLSQFIFKHPGALGQPWHQDAFYFPFDRGPQVGAWLAVTEATLDNGPLWVLPGSHEEPVHPVVADSREGANFGYVEIVDHDMEQAVPVLLKPGDLLLFHSHLMHKSTDNGSDAMRAAMVYHYAEAGTVDHSVKRFGFQPPNVDWFPVLRAGLPTPEHG